MLRIAAGEENVFTKIYDDSFEKGSSYYIKSSILVPVLVYMFFHKKSLSIKMQFK
jgi:hypothetical protein